MKRRVIQSFLILIVLLGVFFFFYFYAPQIWGEVFYPLKYKNEVALAAEEFDLPRNFILAVIFNESHFNPRAVSHVGARGLMQLMPGTARSIAKRINLKDYRDAQIFDPAINIRLGTAYLKSYYDLYQGDIEAVLVAYNAGPSVSGRYINNRNRWVLPRETANFIRRVKYTWQAYDKIYGADWQGRQKKFVRLPKTSFIQSINIFNLLNLFRK